jgi:hypothetical protein
MQSCTKDKALSNTDKELLEMSKTTKDFVWFKNTDSLLAKSSGSGHPQALLRTRYNAIAAKNLDNKGKILPGAIFPDGSLIVKELFENPSKLVKYAILYKNPKSNDADAKGWVWGYINSDETVDIPASKKGTSCIKCHTQVDNIDYMLMNKFFP